ERPEISARSPPLPFPFGESVSRISCWHSSARSRDRSSKISPDLPRQTEDLPPLPRPWPDPSLPIQPATPRLLRGSFLEFRWRRASQNLCARPFWLTATPPVCPEAPGELHRAQTQPRSE